VYIYGFPFKNIATAGFVQIFLPQFLLFFRKAWIKQTVIQADNI